MSRARTGLWLAMLMLLTLAVWLWIELTGAAAAGIRSSGPDRDASLPATANAVPAHEAGRVPAVAPDDARPANATPSSVPTPIILAGRCIDIDTKEPAAGVQMSIHIDPYAELTVARRGPPRDAAAPQTTISGPDGRFEFLLERAPGFTFRLAEVDSRWAGRERYVPELIEPPRLELGEYRVLRLHDARVRVLDPDRKPVAGVGVRATFTDWRTDGSARVATSLSAEDGFATLAPGLPPGTAHYSITSGPVWPCSGTIRFDPAQAVPEILVERCEVALAGRVVDAGGQAVAGVRVVAMAQASGDGTRWSEGATTTADGSFTIPAIHPAPDGWTLGCDRPWLDPGLVHRVFPSGTTGLALTVAPFGAIAIEVVRSVDSTPIERFAVGWDASRELRRHDPEPVGTQHIGGRAVLQDVPPGTWQIAVFPIDRALAHSKPIPVTVAPGGTVAVRVSLLPAPAIRVRVLAERAPVHAARVELLTLGDARGASASASFDDLAAPRGGSLSGVGYRVAEGHTDEDGSVTLYPGTNHPLHVRASAAGFIPTIDALAPATRDVLLELKRGAALAVRLVPRGIVEDLHRVHEEEAGQQVRPPGIRLFRLLDGDRLELLGTFGSDTCRLHGLEPGAYRLGLSIPGVLRESADRLPWLIQYERPARVAADAEADEVVFDLAELQPAGVDLQVNTEHGPLRRGFVFLSRESDSKPLEVGDLIVTAQMHAATDDEGRIRGRMLLPGTYRVRARDDGGSGYFGGMLTARDPLVIAAGARVDATVLVRDTSIRITVTDPDGQPLRHCWLRVEGRSARGPQTNVHGRIRLDHDQGGRVTVELHRAQNPARSFEWLPAGCDRASAEFTWDPLADQRELALALRPAK